MPLMFKGEEVRGVSQRSKVCARVLRVLGGGGRVSGWLAWHVRGLFITGNTSGTPGAVDVRGHARDASGSR